ncbi:DnaJ C-terminal domain-containing protein [Jannaschia rubra]|uniref:DnaJ C-terminal domain-containing protein n=1 Tax=Jannaschia rubra TaxID=282197 RepID=UPI002492A467|nr:DnaJ C-terminal domain-containing protein [Jannaschia rubra]
MADDPYAALGVSKTADTAGIKKAYRRIARTAHPDLHPDDPTAEARFKAASAAYDLLKDPEQRARFDRGEIDAQGAERAPRGYYRDAAGGRDDTYSTRGFGGRQAGPDIDPDDIFAQFSRRGARGNPFEGFGGFGGDARGGRFDMPGQDRHYTLQLSFLDAVRGTKTRITLPEGGDLAVTIPEGAADGLTLRLRGKGGPGLGDGPPGDAYVTLSVADDPVFSRDGDDIRVGLDIAIDEAVLGAKVPVPTIDGEVNVTVPPGASSGQTLRLRGRGVSRRGGGRGDQLVELRIVSPATIDDDLKQFMERWRREHAHDPRQRQDRKRKAKP